MENIVILGSTGSIGKNCLEILEYKKERFHLTGIAGRRNLKDLLAQTEKYRPEYVVVWDKQDAGEFAKKVPSGVQVLAGMEGLQELASLSQVNTVVNALVGAVGLLPTVSALERGKKVALANKETLVIGGEIINTLLKEKQGTLLPIDSEHSALHQCCCCTPKSQIENLILTASGGPFRTRDENEFAAITPEMALKHPNWEMGNKITIDSATLMNKGLEVIEAHFLFHLPYEAIQVVVHPQSIIHSLVQFRDGSLLAQLGPADMKIPIQYALSYPDKWDLPVERINLAEIGQFTFQEPDLEKFPCLKIAFEAGRLKGTVPTVMNAANEVAVDLFLNKKIGFNDIPRLIETELTVHQPIQNPTIKEILTADREVRKKMEKC